MLSGILVYFWLSIEPWPWLGLSVLVVATIVCLAIKVAVLRVLALGIGLAAGGFAVSQLSTHLAAAPVLSDEIGPRLISGVIEAVETGKSGTRIVLSSIAIAGLDPAETPGRVRIVVRTHGDQPVPGSYASILAVLKPPSPPTWPGGFDFARRSFFQGIGGIGYAVGPLHLEHSDSNAGGWRNWVEGVRQDVTDRILGALDPPTGAVAAALLTGQRYAVPEATYDTIRRAGLAHLLAISGLHLGLVAAALFVSFRAVAALIEPVALKYPIKKWAAVFALVGTFCYLLLSGATVPTQRAFIMTAIVLGAIMIERDPFSMRLVAVAALVVMVIAPVSVLGPSFQLSFAAVIALIAVYEAIRMRWPAWRARRSFVGRLALYVAGLSITTVIANLATAGFVLAHFNRWAVYGLAANLVAVPITAFWVMPWGLLALALMPFGLEQLALVPMGWGIDAVLLVAEWTSETPGAVLRLPSPPSWLPVLVGFGLLWLCLWRGRWRVWGVLPVLVAIVVWSLARGPDLLVSGNARLMAVRDDAGTLLLSSYRRETFVGDQWLAMAGQKRGPPWPAPGEALLDESLRCDEQGCVYYPLGQGGPGVGIVEDGAILAEDCARTVFVVSLVPIGDGCAAPWGAIDRFDLWREGTHALWFDEGGVIVETVAGAQGRRPWAPWPEPRDESQ
ncbi:MAG: ComEC/Rec2 family competence protein [Pseudomonadota bacterium]